MGPLGYGPGHVGVQRCTLEFDVDMRLLLFNMVIFYALALCDCHGHVLTCRPMGACIACLVISAGGVCGRCWS